MPPTPTTSMYQQIIAFNWEKSHTRTPLVTRPSQKQSHRKLPHKMLHHVLRRMPTAAGQVRAPSELMHLKGGIADAACWRLLHSCGCCHE